MPVENNPQEVAVSPYEKKIYVTNLGNLKVIGSIAYVIDTTTNTVTNTVAVGYNPYRIAIGYKRYKNNKR